MLELLWRKFLHMVLLKKLLLNKTCKITAVYEQICSSPRNLTPFFIHNFPRQLGWNNSLFFYFCAICVVKRHWPRYLNPLFLPHDILNFRHVEIKWLNRLIDAISLVIPPNFCPVVDQRPLGQIRPVGVGIEERIGFLSWLLFTLLLAAWVMVVEAVVEVAVFSVVVIFLQIKI